MTKINKTTIETIKTVLIAILITGILAFGAGAWTMNRYSDRLIDTARSFAPETAQAQAAPAPEAQPSK